MSLLRKIKTRYGENVNEKSTIDNKLFWNKVKLFLSDKIVSKNKTRNEPFFQAWCRISDSNRIQTPASRKEILDVHVNYRVYIYSETRT